MTSSMTFSNNEPYQSIEGNVRADENVIVWCAWCHDEASVISNDGKQGLCDECYDRYEEQRYDYD